MSLRYRQVLASGRPECGVHRDKRPVTCRKHSVAGSCTENNIFQPRYISNAVPPTCWVFNLRLFSAMLKPRDGFGPSD